jgi:alpha-beta hydrolase superfamily lysophospholipase
MTALPLVRTFTDAEGIEITFYEWPVAEPRAVVQIAHGLGEHAMRYNHVAAVLNRAGFSVYADDHRGHGQTGKRMIERAEIKRMGNLGKGGMSATVNQVYQLSKLIKTELPTLELYLLGHSWGSMLAQKILNQNSHSYAGALLSGSTLMLPGVAPTSGFNKKWDKTPNKSTKEWLSRDESVGRAFMADPLCFGETAIEVFGITNVAGLVSLPSKKIDSDFAILLIAGSEDPLGAERGNMMLAKAFARAGVQDVTMIIYPEARHEVFNELNKQEVFADVIAWLETSISKASS